MSIRDAIAQATRQSLSAYLSQELVEQLTEEIMHRVAPEVESTVKDFVGFELSHVGALRHKAQKSVMGHKKPGRKSHTRPSVAADAQNTRDVGATDGQQGDISLS